MDTDDWEPIKTSKFSEDLEDIFKNSTSQLKPNPNHSKTLLKFLHGDPSASGRIQIHENMKHAVQKTLKDPKTAGYTLSFGTKESREALARYYSTPANVISPNDIILTLGSQGALNIILRAFCNESDNFLVPSPSYPYLASISKALKINYKTYKLNPEAEWEVDIEDLEKNIDDKTRFILINNPGNPTGSVYSRKHLEDIVAVAEKHKISIVSDESYADMNFKGVDFVPVSHITTDVPIVQVGGLSNFMAPGWKLGWMIFHDQNQILSEVMGGVKTLTQIVLHPPSFLQVALPEILETVPAAHLQDVMSRFKKAYDVLGALFTNELKSYFRFIPAKGGISCFVLLTPEAFKDIQDENQFCQKLLEEENVLLAPAGAFISEVSGFRITFVEDFKDYEELSSRLQEFCKRHAK